MRRSGGGARAADAVAEVMTLLRRERLAAVLEGRRPVPGEAERAWARAQGPRGVADMVRAVLRHEGLDAAQRGRLVHALAGPRWADTAAALRGGGVGGLGELDRILAAAGAPVSERLRACGLRPLPPARIAGPAR